MNYFSGFLFENEQYLFSSYLNLDGFVVAGFSHGAIKAFEYTLHTSQRVDRLLLLSPAFFQDTSPGFKRMQMRYFQSNKEEYIKNFIYNVSLPNTDIDLNPYLCDADATQLQELLDYKWCSNKLEQLKAKEITIEVFIGAKDSIINPQKAFEFFNNQVPTYMINHGGHLLDVK